MMIVIALIIYITHWQMQTDRTKLVASPRRGYLWIVKIADCAQIVKNCRSGARGARGARGTYIHSERVYGWVMERFLTCYANKQRETQFQNKRRGGDNSVASVRQELSPPRHTTPGCRPLVKC